MRLNQESIAEVWDAKGKWVVPCGAVAIHLESERHYDAKQRLKRADRQGNVLICRDQIQIELRELEVTLRRGEAGPAVFVIWCSVELTPSETTILADLIINEDKPLRFKELEERLEQNVEEMLRHHAESHDLTRDQGQLEIRNCLLQNINVDGFQVRDLSFRRVLSGSEYVEEKRVWSAFQLELHRLLQDEELAQENQGAELEKALAAIENDKVRSLLSETEKTLEATVRLGKYAQLLPTQHQDDNSQACLHPYCRESLLANQVFTCGHCGEIMHYWHRSRRKRTICDLCDANITGRRKWIALTLVIMVFVCAILLPDHIKNKPETSLPPLSLHWHGFGQRFEDGQWREFQVQDGATMFSGDQFRITFVPTVDCHVYVLGINPDGETSLLFPNPAIKHNNPCRSDHEYCVPDGINFYTLDDNTGTETLLLVASYDPLEQLDALLTKASDRSAKQLVESIEKDVDLLNRPDDSGVIRTRSGITVRDVVIRPDQRKVKTSTADHQEVTRTMKILQGNAAVVKRLKIAHRD